MKIYEPDIQLVMWNWDKFYLFTVNDKFINGIKDRPDLYKDVDISNRFLANDNVGFKNIMFEDKLEIVPIIPHSIVSNIDINGGGTLNLNFVLNPDEVYKHQLIRRFPIGEEEKRLRESVIERYEIVKKRIEDNSYYYGETEGDLFSEEVLEHITDYSEPLYIFQPMNILWFFAKDSDDKWCKMWTGLITNVTESDSSGQERQITIKAVNFLEKSAQIPIVHQRWAALLFPDLIKRQDPLQQAMWIIWLSSSLLPPSDSPSFDALSQDLEKVFNELGNQFNRSMGLLPRNSAEKNNIMERVQKNPVFYGESGLIPPSKLDSYINSFFSEIRRIRPYRFRVYAENFEANDIKNVYKGESNYITLEDDGYITIDDLINEDGSVARTMWGDNWVDPDKILAFNKILKQTANLWDLQFTSMYGIYKKISGLFQSNIYNDVHGNLVMDYPHYNSFPTAEKVTVVQSEEHYKDMDSRYIIDKFTGKFDFSQDIGQIVTMLTVPAEYHYGQSLNKLDSVFLTGYSWGSLEELLTYGFSRADMQTIFTAYGVGDPTTSSLWGFLDKIADDLRQKQNQNVFSGSFTANALCNLQVGRNCLIPHREKTYFISSIAVNWNAGNQLTTSFGLTHGKSLWKELPNPWKNDLAPIVNLQVPTIATKEDIESWLIQVNLDNVCKIMKEKLPEMMNIIFGADKDLWLNRVNALCDNTKTTVEGWNYLQTALYSIMENSEDAFVSGGNIVIDPRLLYIAAMLSGKVYENKYVWQELTESALKKNHSDIIDAYPIMKLARVPYFKERRKCGRSLKITGIATTKIDTRSLNILGTRASDDKELVLDYCRKQTEIHPLIKVDMEKEVKSRFLSTPLAAMGTSWGVPIANYQPEFFDMELGERVASYIEECFQGKGFYTGANEFGKNKLYLDSDYNKAHPFVAIQKMKTDSLGIEFTRLLEDKKIEFEQTEMDATLVVDRICEDIPSEIEVSTQLPPSSNVKSSYFGGSFITFDADTNYGLYACYLQIKQNFLKELYHDEILLSLNSDFSGE